MTETLHKVTYYDEKMFRYTTEYRNNFGQLHRSDGPALEYSDGDYEWHSNGRLHNLNGYARSVKNAQNIYLEYWVYGKQYVNIEAYYEYIHRNNKHILKQNIRKNKFKKILDMNITLTLTNVNNINISNMSIIDNNKIETILKKHNDYVEIWSSNLDEYKTIKIIDIDINEHIIIKDNNKFKIINILSEE